MSIQAGKRPQSARPPTWECFSREHTGNQRRSTQSSRSPGPPGRRRAFGSSASFEHLRCAVLQGRPGRTFSGQRLFEGMIWIKKDDYGIVRTEGQALPQIRRMKQENLFPRFTTIRKPIDGKHWFPVYTYADDTLGFRGGPQRERLRIAYSNYKRFGAESTFTPK